MYALTYFLKRMDTITVVNDTLIDPISQMPVVAITEAVTRFALYTACIVVF